LIDAGQLEVAYCPEFLREGSAIFDYNHPALAVLGSDTGEKIQIAEDLMGVCQWFAWEGAEMIKYGCNFWHAVKVGFANEIGRLCKHVNVDAGRLMATLVTDEKLNISSYYMRPGNPFGGSCLPKDVAALSSFSRQSGINLPLLDSLLSTNQSHLDSLVRIVSRTEVKSVMILGLTFKDNTDDLRGSPMVALAETLLGRGFTVRVYDPKLDAVKLKGSNQEQITRRMPHLAAIMVRDIAEGLRNCRVVVVAHKNVSIDVLAQLVTPEHHVIDVNGWAELNELPCAVEGLCW
jgi:GDP-mannose 6-dehydrogenase